MTTKIQRTTSPVDGSVYLERPLASEPEVKATIDRAVAAQRAWRGISLPERAALLSKLVDAVVAQKAGIAEELTWQMGRPIRDAPGEVNGFEERARYMIEVAAEALAEIRLPEKSGFVRFIRREPLGVVFVVAPWNYPYLTSVNAVVPALMAGNAVILKSSSQTPRVAERYTEAAAAAGFPEGLLQHLHTDHEGVSRVIVDPAIDYVAFTGSVEGGRAVHRAAADKFIACGLELGGKDPAYVRADAPMPYSAELLVDGAFYNAGQSCCGIERIYVHQDRYDAFVEAYAEQVRKYILDNPLEPKTTLGPLVRTSAAEWVRGQLQQAQERGARALIDATAFNANKPGSPYLAPQVLVDVDHTMDIMVEETFGPAVGIMKVQDDAEAIRLMNDSHYGLTAAVCTEDPEAALRIGEQVETGTWFMNRCDYLDPALAWVGIKDSGRGCTLSSVGYEHLTRPKSYHLKVKV